MVDERADQISAAMQYHGLPAVLRRIVNKLIQGHKNLDSSVDGAAHMSKSMDLSLTVLATDRRERAWS